MAIAYMTNYGPFELTEVELGPPFENGYGYTATVKYVGTDILAVVPIDVTEKSANYDIVFENGAKVTVGVDQPIGVIYRNITVLLFDKDGTYPGRVISKRYYPNDSIGHVYLYCDSGRNMCNAGAVSENWNEPDYDGRITWQGNTCGLENSPTAYSDMFGGLDEYMSDIKQVRLSNNLYDVVDVSGRAAIAPNYDILHTYGKDDYAFYEDALYQCQENGVTGEFDNEKWILVSRGIAERTNGSPSSSSSEFVLTEYPDVIDYTIELRLVPYADSFPDEVHTAPFMINEGAAFRFNNPDYDVCICVKLQDGTVETFEIDAYTDYYFIPRLYGLWVDFGPFWSAYGVNQVWFMFTRKVGREMNPEIDFPAIRDGIEFRRKNESPKSNLDAINRHLLSEYNRLLDFSEFDEFSHDRDAFDGADGNISSDGFWWSPWIPANTGRLLVLRQGDWEGDTNGLVAWKIGAVYESDDPGFSRAGAQYRYAGTMYDEAVDALWDSTCNKFEMAICDRVFEIPEQVSLCGYGNDIILAHLVAFQIGFTPNIKSTEPGFNDELWNDYPPYYGADFRVLMKQSDYHEAE